MTMADQAEDPWGGSSIAASPGEPAVPGVPAVPLPSESPDPTVAAFVDDPLAPIEADRSVEDDRELLALVRAGNEPGADPAIADAAFAELFARHAGAVRGYALRCAKDPADAEDIAAEAFFRVLQAVRRGSGPADHVRAYLFTVVRRLAAELGLRNRDVPVADEELTRRVGPDVDQVDGRADQRLIAAAFSSLPQRWRRVLWRVEVEGQRPAVVAGQFGLSPNATAALARRAREGLRAAYLQAHVAPSMGPTGCRAVADRLGAYTAGQLRGGEARRIRAHLAGCADCSALYAELSDVCAGLRRYAGALVPPIVVGAGAAAAGARLLGAKPAAGMAAGKAMAKLGLTARLAGVTARAKLAVAAASVVMVGGVGMGLGPLLMHAGPSSYADGDDHTVVLPVIGSSAPSGAAVSQLHSGSVLTTTNSAHPAHPAAHTQVSAPGRTSPDSSSAASSSVGGALVATTAPTTTPTTPTEQLFAGTPTSTDDSAAPGERPVRGPISQTPDDPADSTTPTTDQPDTRGSRTPPSVWSTVYTSDGTTVWETIWEWDGNN